MQTQQLNRIKSYIDRELLAQRQHQSEVWYFFYPNAVHQLIADSKAKQVIGLSVLSAEKLYDKSLSELKEVIGQFEFAKGDYEQTHAVVVDSHYTFVPEPLFDAAEAATYLKLIHPTQKFTSVYHERFQQTVDVYAIPDLFYNAIRIAMPGVVFHHYAGMLNTACAQLNDKKQKDRVYVNFMENSMDVFYYHGNQLQYHNHFPFEADTDIVYFILAVVENLKLPMDKWEIVLSGQITAENSLLGLMKKYMPNVLLMKRPGHLTFPSAFRELQEQQYFIELSALLCE